MSKVYIVALVDYEQHDTLGVFLNVDKAGSFFLEEQDKLRQRYTRDGYERYHSCEIVLEEYDLID